MGKGYRCAKRHNLRGVGAQNHRSIAGGQRRQLCRILVNTCLELCRRSHAWLPERNADGGVRRRGGVHGEGGGGAESGGSGSGHVGGGHVGGGHVGGGHVGGGAYAKDTTAAGCSDPSLGSSAAPHVGHGDGVGRNGHTGDYSGGRSCGYKKDGGGIGGGGYHSERPVDRRPRVAGP